MEGGHTSFNIMILLLRCDVVPDHMFRLDTGSIAERVLSAKPLASGPEHQRWWRQHERNQGAHQRVYELSIILAPQAAWPPLPDCSSAKVAMDMQCMLSGRLYCMQVRLRRPGDPGSFLPEESVLGTLLHELVHNVQVGSTTTALSADHR
jgi:hypothetical protein